MFNPLQNFNNLNKNSSGIDQYGEYIEQTYGDPEFDQKRDDFLQTVSQQEQQTFGGGMNSFAPSITHQPFMGRPMFQNTGSPFGGFSGNPLANQQGPRIFDVMRQPPAFGEMVLFQEGGSVSGPPPTHGPDANGVSNRRMFRNRDSRKKLAQMGGILSSSPELQETAMTFANGGGADLPDYIINVPGLTDVGEYLRISSATLEKLNNAVPEIMANASMVSPVEMVISEGFSSLVANARPGDAVVGTRVNRLREQRAASDPSRVPIPPETAQISSAADEFAKSKTVRDAIREQLAGTYSKNLAGGTGESSLETLIRESIPASQATEMSGDPYAGDIFSDDRIRFRPRENIGGGIEAQDAANFALESGIAKAVVPKSVLSSEQNAVLNAIDEFSFPSSTKQVVESPAEELINVSGPLPEAFTGTETGNKIADAANATAVLTGTAEPEVVVPKSVPTTESKLSDVENATAIRGAALDVPAGVVGAKVETAPDDPDYSGQVESGTSKESSPRPPSFRRNADGVFITDDTQDSAVETMEPPILPQEIPKEVSDAPGKGDDNEQDGTFETIEKFDTSDTLLEEIKRTSGQLDDPTTKLPQIPETVTEKIDSLGDDSGMGNNIAGDGGIADLTKGYVKVLKSLLGESDEDKAARKGELFMLMGAALMSGKSSNAITNIGDALQIGAKAAIQDRATRKKRDDTIGLKGFEMAADRIAKRDAQQLALDKEGRDKKTQLELIDARLVATNDAAQFRFDLDNLGYKKMGEYRGLGRIFETAQDGFSNEGIKKPKGITLLEYFEKLARENNYSQAQIDRYNTYFGISPSAVKDDKSGPSKAEKDLYEGLK